MDLSYLNKPEQLKPDFGWWLDGDTFDVEKNHRNKNESKDELALQWGEGDYIVQTTDNNVPVARIANKKEETQTAFVMQARSMMNAGMTTASIREYFEKHQNPAKVAACQGEIDKQLKLAGAVGRFVLDARGYKSCEEAWKYASKNPFKKYMQYMIGCTCSKPIQIKTKTAKALSSTGDVIYDLLNQKDESEETTKNLCSQTGIQVMSGQGDVDSSWAGNTMIDVMNACDLSKETGKTFTASKEQPYMRLKKFFIALDEGLIDKNREVLDLNTQTEDDLSVNPMQIQMADMGIPYQDVEFDKNDSISFGLNKDVDTTPLDIEQKSMSFELPSVIEEDSLLVDGEAADLNIDEFENDAEIIPVELPKIDGSSFSLNQTSSKDNLLVNCKPSSIVIDIPVTESQEIVFGENDEDEFFKQDGELELEGSPKKEEMLFSF